MELGGFVGHDGASKGVLAAVVGARDEEDSRELEDSEEEAAAAEGEAAMGLAGTELLMELVMLLPLSECVGATVVLLAGAWLSIGFAVCNRRVGGEGVGDRERRCLIERQGRQRGLLVGAGDGGGRGDAVRCA